VAEPLKSTGWSAPSESSLGYHFALRALMIRTALPVPPFELHQKRSMDVPAEDCVEYEAPAVTR